MILDRLSLLDTSHASETTGLSRRNFLQASAAIGGGLLLGMHLPFAGQAEAAVNEFAPNAFIRIGSDGHVTLVMPYVEMGQGIYTAVSMLIAEELEVELSQIKFEHAPANEKLYGNPALGGLQATGNSTAIPRRMAAYAPGRRRCTNHADSCRSEALGRRSVEMPRRKGSCPGHDVQPSRHLPRTRCRGRPDERA